jgi:hypothetical protein
VIEHLLTAAAIVAACSVLFALLAGVLFALRLSGLISQEEDE